VVEGISCVSSITYAGIRRKVLIMSHLARLFRFTIIWKRLIVIICEE